MTSLLLPPYSKRSSGPNAMDKGEVGISMWSTDGILDHFESARNPITTGLGPLDHFRSGGGKTGTAAGPFQMASGPF
jgi:hypothetical protein